jgi:hypothetical protein
MDSHNQDVNDSHLGSPACVHLDDAVPSGMVLMERNGVYAMSDHLHLPAFLEVHMPFGAISCSKHVSMQR